MLVPIRPSGVGTRRSANRGPSTSTRLSGSEATRSELATTAAAAVKVGTMTTIWGGQGMDPEPDIGRHRIEIVSGGQPPADLVAREAVIAEVVIGIGDQDVEHQPAPELPQILGRPGAL
jgi:hypothetical protein